MKLNVIIKPLISEASMKDAHNGKFTFLVLPSATKTEIRSAVQKLFKVKVTDVSTVSLTRHKTVFTKFGRKNVTTNIKKARVKLAEGQTIPAFELGEKDDKKAKKEKKVEKKEEKESK